MNRKKMILEMVLHQIQNKLYDSDRLKKYIDKKLLEEYENKGDYIKIIEIFIKGYNLQSSIDNTDLVLWNMMLDENRMNPDFFKWNR